MAIYQESIYKQIEKFILIASQKNSHLLIYSFSGAGASYLLKSFVKKHPHISYIDCEGKKLSSFSIIDTPLALAQSYYSQADLNQKLALVISRGQDYHSSFGNEVRNHAYLSGVIGSRNLIDTQMLIKKIDPKISLATQKNIYALSGGIGKLAKFLTVNGLSYDPLVSESIITEIRESLFGYTPTELELLGVIDHSGVIKSQMLRSSWQPISDFKLTLNFDLSFEENGKKSIYTLTFSEKQILEKMLQNGGQITKEEISNLKWGGNYDSFSDQAINKTMRRLNDKFSTLEIKTIPKLGFLLQKK